MSHLVLAPAPPVVAVAPAVAASVPPPTLAPVSAAPPTAAPPSLDDRLPVFTTLEATVEKIDNRNALVFSVPTKSSLLLRLVAPPCHAYEERDYRWLHLLQAIAAVPSRKVETLTKLAAQALELMLSPKHKPRLEAAVQNLVAVLSSDNSTLSFSQKAMLALRLKDQVARFLREWVQDPVEGFVLRKDHVVDEMRLDDLVATPVGAGYLRGYRREDSCCIVVYPWGHGYIHRSNVEPLDVAIDHERKKRRHNEYLALEHQHLFEQVESLLENYPPESTGEDDVAEDGRNIDLEEYQRLLEELQQERIDPDVVEHDLSFVRRVQALAHKLSKRQRGSPQHNDDEEEAPVSIKQEVDEATEPMDVEEEKEMEPQEAVPMDAE